MSFGNVIALVVAAVIVVLMAGEARSWSARRGDAMRRSARNARLVRRAVGAGLLLVVLLLLNLPFPRPDSPYAQLWKLVGCLGLCGVVFLIALRDVRALAREVEGEVQDFTAQSARELRQYMEAMSKGERAEHGDGDAGS